VFLVARRSSLGPRLQPRLLTRGQAAAYLGLPTDLFDRLGFGPLRIAGRERYDRHELDDYIDGLSSPGDEDAEAALDRFISKRKTP
jgi:hypothetical protein